MAAYVVGEQEAFYRAASWSCQLSSADGRLAGRVARR